VTPPGIYGEPGGTVKAVNREELSSRYEGAAAARYAAELGGALKAVNRKEFLSPWKEAAAVRYPAKYS
jgi:hypothetical protein